MSYNRKLLKNTFLKMKIFLAILLLLLDICSSAVNDSGTKCSCDVSPSNQIADCEFRNLETVPSCVPDGITMLLVSGNPLLLDERTFHRFHGLRKIVMRKVNNSTGTLPENLFNGNPNLHWISMGWNHLTTLPDKIFQNSQLIEDLDLWANELTEIPAAVQKLTALKVLTLDRNNISTLNISALEHFTSLRRLSLRRNPLLCDCHLKPLFEWANNHNVTQVVTAKCEQPSSLNGRTLLYAFKDMDCKHLQTN